MSKQSKVYLAINATSASIFIFFLEMYIELLRPQLQPSDPNLAESNSGISELLSPVATLLSSPIIAFILQSLGLSAVFFLVRGITGFVYTRYWNFRHKDILIKGSWLSIHVKDNGDIRVGTVEIKQKYYDLKVSGMNIYKIQVLNKTLDDIKMNGLGDNELFQRLTVWEYHASYIRDYINRPDFVGYYSSARQNEDIESNEGIHVLRKGSNSKTPEYFFGTFNDVHRKGDHTHQDDSHTGKLMLYRLNKSLKRIVCENSPQKRNELSQEFIRSILNCNETVPFVRDLQNAIKDNCIAVQPTVPPQ